MIERVLISRIQKSLTRFPVTAIIGPRQVGKTTLAKAIVAEQEGIYIDLESPRERSRLDQPEDYFELHQDQLICLDEVQLMPHLFPILRSVVDRHDIRFLLLGSASPDLLNQSAESLAGRIAYHELTGLTYLEYGAVATDREAWLRGGFPNAILQDEEGAFEWLKAFTRTFLERDLSLLGEKISVKNMARLWSMLAHLNGTTINKASLSRSLGISQPTVSHYIDVLEHAFIVRNLPSYSDHSGKRLIKQSKMYLRDTGVLHSLLRISSYDDLYGHPVYGASYEGHVIEEICSVYHDWDPYYYRTTHGAEIDLIMVKGRYKVAIEIKASSAPKVTRGFWSALDDVQPDRQLIIAPVDEVYPYNKETMVHPLAEVLQAGKLL